ncbi:MULTISPECIES: hypothetical protein [Streptomyces]|uniref:hypothetical protein n=1 Tax=Streptomyces TaxID=1883 RepID=UPI001EE63867|nr:MULTISPECIES: hypothetical protein [Streptomyces]
MRDTLMPLEESVVDARRIGNFAPTAGNIAKLPFGEHGLKAWQYGSKPTYDPPPEIYQEPWLDDYGLRGRSRDSA